MPQDTHSFGINIPDEIHEKIIEAKGPDEYKGHFILRCVREHFAAERGAGDADVEIDEDLIEDCISQYVNGGQRTLAGTYENDSPEVES